MVLDKKTTTTLDQIRELVKNPPEGNKLPEGARAQVDEVYHALTGKVLSKGCTSCLRTAFKIINNYMEHYEPKPVLEPVKDEDDNLGVEEIQLGAGSVIEHPSRIVRLGSLGFELGYRMVNEETGKAYFLPHLEIMTMDEEDFVNLIDKLPARINETPEEETPEEETPEEETPEEETPEEIEKPEIPSGANQDEVPPVPTANPFEHFNGTWQEFEEYKTRYLAGPEKMKYAELFKLAKYYGYKGFRMSTEQCVEFIEQSIKEENGEIS